MCTHARTNTHGSTDRGWSLVWDRMMKCAEKGKCFLGSDVWQEISENWCRVNRHWQLPHLLTSTRELHRADTGQRTLVTLVCAWERHLGFFFPPLIFFLLLWSPRELRMWSWAEKTTVVAHGQQAGNLNLNTHRMQLPDLLPQAPGLRLHAGYFVPHPAEHYHDSDLRWETQDY